MDTRLEELLERLEDDLFARAFLFDHPVQYREGVAAAMTGVRALLDGVSAAA